MTLLFVMPSLIIYHKQLIYVDNIVSTTLKSLQYVFTLIIIDSYPLKTHLYIHVKVYGCKIDEDFFILYMISSLLFTKCLSFYLISLLTNETQENSTGIFKILIRWLCKSYIDIHHFQERAFHFDTYA